MKKKENIQKKEEEEEKGEDDYDELLHFVDGQELGSQLAMQFKRSALQIYVFCAQCTDIFLKQN